MTTATKEPTTSSTTAALTLPEPVNRRGITEAQWRTLCGSLFPGANPQSVLLVWDYCIARRLDPMKKPCHIVPMEVKDAKTGRYEYRDVVMPGIYELRTTATRTGQYLGHSEPTYSEDTIDVAGAPVPEWCAMTMYRWNDEAKMRAEFPVRAWFREVVATKKDGKPNARWSKAPIQMLTKCTEAAGLREAFPDELGGEQTAEEMDGQRAIDLPDEKPAPAMVKPDSFDAWLPTIELAAKAGEETFAKAWAAAPEACRKYLTVTDPDAFENLRSVALDPVQPA